MVHIFKRFEKRGQLRIRSVLYRHNLCKIVCVPNILMAAGPCHCFLAIIVDRESLLSPGALSHATLTKKTILSKLDYVLSKERVFCFCLQCPIQVYMQVRRNMHCG